MLFKTRFHEGIRQGAITATIRAWRSERVKVGNRYLVGALGRIEVEAIDRIRLEAIRPRDAKESGFGSVASLTEMLREQSDRRLTAKSYVYRVRFHFAGEGDDPQPSYSTEELAARLARMDGSSSKGRWTRQVLELISKRPLVAASELASHLGRERTAFKADVRKLKKLGLTTSHAVGYELTDAARALLRSRTYSTRFP